MTYKVWDFPPVMPAGDRRHGAMRGLRRPWLKSYLVDRMMHPKGIIKPSVYVRYILLQLIELAVVVLTLLVVRQWWTIPDGLFWGLVLAWMIKDAVLFPFVWRAYDQDAPRAADGMIGERGVAKSMLDSSGYVQVRGELWKAVRAGDGPPIAPGCAVRVLFRKGLVLYVTSDANACRQSLPK